MILDDFIQKRRFVIIAFAFIVGAFISYKMMNLPLWGNLPLILFLSIWAIAVFIRIRTIDKNLMALSTLSGILLSLGFPMMPLAPLMFVAFVPLLFIENKISASIHKLSASNLAKKEIKSLRSKLWRYAYNAFWLWNILTTFWVANTAFIAGVLANMINAAFMAATFMAFHYIKTKLGEKYGYLSFIVLWISFEYIHLNWELTWPWLTLGNSFATLPSCIQWYEFTGVFGGSLWILLLNVLIFKLLINNDFDFKKIKIYNVYRIILIMAIPVVISLLRYYTVDISGYKTAETVVVQPNYEPHYQKFDIEESIQLDHFLALSKEKVSSSTDYLLYPETSFRRIVLNDFYDLNTINLLRNYVNQYPKLHLIFGADTYRRFAFNDAYTSPNIRESNDGTRWEAYNGALQLSNEKPIYDHYKKSKFVPGAEILPYRNLFFFLKPLVEYLGGSMSGLGSQPERSVFKNEILHTAVAPVICYESIFGDYLRHYVQNGAEAVFVVTNDGWWDDTPGHKQHCAFASLGAISLRRDFVRSANSGISCFINARGDIRQMTAYNSSAAIKDTVQLRNDKTFYAKFGDYIAFLAVGISIILLTLYLYSFIKK